MKRKEALGVAQSLVDDIAPVCARIQIAGSLRRCTPEVKDIELLIIPARGELIEDLDLFGEVIESRYVCGLEEELNSRIARGWGWRRDMLVKRWGERYKRLRHASGICCDMFITDEKRWGYQLAIRTGPAEFSRALVTLALRRGWHFKDSLLHQHPKVRGAVCLKGEDCPLIIPTLKETDIFEALGLPWLDPAGREAEWIWARMKDKVFRESN